MILIAILCVLIFIAIILAPWLLAVLAAGVVAYGIYLVAAAALFIVAVVVCLSWLLFKSFLIRDPKPVELKGPRKSCPSCSVEQRATARRCRSCGAAI